MANFNRKADKYGDLHFISFLGSTLSRLAYFNDNNFLTNYKKIIGPVIVPKILSGINSVTSDRLGDLLDDQKIFGLTGLKDGEKKDIFADYEYQYNGKNFIDFIKLNMPQNINIINGELSGNEDYMVKGNPTQDSDVKYISIGWSNYGEIYVVADKRMPNTIFLIFRGTYSAKTAGLYLKPTSLVPLTVCNDEKFLYGIFKPTTEMIHTIIESLRYLATDFLGKTLPEGETQKPNSVKIFTTGHSLGGAMCSNFAYLWMGIKKTAPYNSAPYNVLADNIVCVSLGSPRCMGSSVAQKFCNFADQKKILYLRITTRGDPVPGLPPKSGFEHPCSTNEEMRKQISEDCNSTLTMRPFPNVNYTADLDCQNYKTRSYLPNPASHTIYLDIKFTNAVDIPKFFKGIGIAQEVSRDTDKSTVCRLIMGENGEFKAAFFNVNKARETASNLDIQEEVQEGQEKPESETILQSEQGNLKSEQDNLKGAGLPTSISSLKPSIKFGGKVAEDVRMTPTAFNSLIGKMAPLQGDLCPQEGTIENPFNDKIMPDLSCPISSATGATGGRKRTQRKRKSKSKRKSKRKGRSKRIRSRRY